MREMYHDLHAYGRGVEVKKCPHCGEMKPLSEFDLRTDGGPRSWCRPCNAERSRVYGVEYRALTRMRHAQAAGLGEPDVCEVCGGPVEVLDHNHRTGLARGWLCNRCNRAAGFLRDDPSLARELAAYLESRGHA